MIEVALYSGPWRRAAAPLTTSMQPTEFAMFPGRLAVPIQALAGQVLDEHPESS